MGDTAFMPDSAITLNASMTISALIIAATQILFLYNIIASLKNGEKGRPEPVEGHVARMADAGHAAQARQLGTFAAGGASLGL